MLSILLKYHSAKYDIRLASSSQVFDRQPTNIVTVRASATPDYTPCMDMDVCMLYDLHYSHRSRSLRQSNKSMQTRPAFSEAAEATVAQRRPTKQNGNPSATT